MINIGSIAGIRQSPASDNPAYGASKAGLHHLSTYLGAKLGPEQIIVNAIAPRPFPSDMMARTGLLDELTAGVPLGRAGAMEDAVGAALFLASRAGAYVSGVVLAIDGGSPRQRAELIANADAATACRSTTARGLGYRSN